MVSLLWSHEVPAQGLPSCTWQPEASPRRWDVGSLACSGLWDGSRVCPAWVPLGAQVDLLPLSFWISLGLAIRG